MFRKFRANFMSSLTVGHTEILLHFTRFEYRTQPRKNESRTDPRKNYDFKKEDLTCLRQENIYIDNESCYDIYNQILLLSLDIPTTFA